MSFLKPKRLRQVFSHSCVCETYIDVRSWWKIKGVSCRWLVSLRFSGAEPRPSSPQGCPRYRTTCVPEPRTLSVTTGGSGSANETHTNTQTHQHTGDIVQFKLPFQQLGCVGFVSAAWRSGERCQRELQWERAGEKSDRPSQDSFGHPDNFCVQSLRFIRYIRLVLILLHIGATWLTAHNHFNIWITVSGCVRGSRIISKVRPQRRYGLRAG